MTPDEQYKVCGKEFAEINRKLDKIYGKLFEDNGGPSMQTITDRNARWIAGVTWALGVMYVAAISILVWFFKK